MAILKKTDIYEGGKALETVKKEIEEIIKLQKQLQTATREVNATGSGTEAQQRIKLTKELESANKRLIKAQSKENEELIKIRNQINEINRQKKLAIQINKAQEGSIEKLRLTTRKLIADRDKLNTTTKAGLKDFRRLTKEININNAQLKKLDAQIGRNQRNVGNYRDALKGLGTQLLGAAGIVGGVQLLIQGFTALRDRTIVLDKATRKIANTFDISRKAAKGLAADITALASNFDKDYNEILNSANAVSKEFGISAERSLALIEEGFKKGSDNSGEFLDILREYPAQLQSVGLSADESFALINQQVRAGVYSDKGIDAIKEAGIALRENTKAVQDALKPLSENVRLEIEREVAAGNTFEAMQLIAKELNNTNLTAAETQAIMSDVFKGAGEDALTFVKGLDSVELSLEGVANQTSKAEDAQLQLSKTWNSLITRLSDDEGFLSKIWAGFINLLSGAIAELERFLKIIGAIDGDGGKAIGKVTEKVTTQKGRTQELTESTKELTEEKKKLNAQYQEDIKWSDAYIKKLEEQRRAEIALLAAEVERRNKLNDIDIQQVDPITGITDEDPIAGLQEQIDAENELRDEQRERELEKEIELQNALKTIKQTFEQEAISFASDATQQIADNTLNQKLNQYQAEEDALKNQLDKGLINEIQYQRKLAEINKNRRIAEAKAERQKALYDIAIQTAVAAVKALPSLIKAATVTAIGLARAAFVAARPLPKFAKGTEYVERGNNPKGTDTIPAMINEGERIVPTHINQMLGGVPNEALPGLIRNKGNKQVHLNNKKLDDIVNLLSNAYSTYTLDGKAYLLPYNGQNLIVKNPERK